MVPPNENVDPVDLDKLLKPILFHDGRLVYKLTPFTALLIPLDPRRLPPHLFQLSPPHASRLLRLLGSRHPRPHPTANPHHILTNPPPSSVLNPIFLSTALNPIFLSTALNHLIPVVTYSLSRFSDLISPIKTVCLCNNRTSDAAMIKKLLQEGGLAICQEGTTCKEPFLLRFWALFVELTNEMVLVAMANRMSMFHGTTAMGWKGMDPFYFFMKPSPVYEVTFPTSCHMS